MSFFEQRRYEIVTGTIFGTLLGIMLLGGIIHSTLLASLPKMYASSVGNESEEDQSTANLTDHQRQKKELGEFESKYQNSIKEAQEESKGRESKSIIYTDRAGNERWGGYLSGQQDWSHWNQVDYQATKERDTSMNIKTRIRPRTEPMDRSIHRYNRSRLSSPYIRRANSVSARHFRLKTFANIGEVNTQPFPKLDYSNYYSSADQRIQKKAKTKTVKPKRLWQILLDHNKEKRK